LRRQSRRARAIREKKADPMPDQEVQQDQGLDRVEKNKAGYAREGGKKEVGVASPTKPSGKKRRINERKHSAAD